MAKKEINEYGNEETKVSTEMIKCPSCGSNMVFDPESQMLYCEHCGTKQSFEQNLKAEEIDFLSGMNEDKKWSSDEATVFTCSNCGAKIVLDKTETAKLCPFCGTAHVEKVNELLGLKPNALLPFQFSAGKAAEFSKKWAKKKIFAPRKFKKSLNPENVNGVYSPCFTFDSCTTSNYVGRIGTRHTRVVGSGKNRRTETYIIWRNISGVYSYDFDDILITAGSKFTQKSLDKISPYDTNSSKEYKENYLLGFMAYHYDKSLEDCWGSAKKIMDDRIKALILKQYHYDVIDYINISTKHERVTYKYVMLPVYIGNFNYKKKLYNFFVNGVSGKVWGKTPVSGWRVLFAVFLGIVIVGAIIGIAYLLTKS